jgi:hypothetical protein
MAEEYYDPNIYSNVSVGAQRMTWRELCEAQETELIKLRKFQQIVSDLDRNEHGRHEGDIDTFDPTGISNGNPKFCTGEVIAYSLGGKPYIMPARGNRHDPDSWLPVY